MDDFLYKLNIPTKIFHGRMIWEKAFQEINSNCNILKGNILIVTTGNSLNKLGYTDKLKSFIKKLSNSCVYVYNDISSNPKLSEITKGIEYAKDNKIETVIGFGGGSALDAAKAIAVGVVAKEKFISLFREEKVPSAALPVIAVPTTSGTGSELSKAAILTDTDMHIKKGLRGEALYPFAAVVDSMFTESIPFGITMETGFDVLAHAVESYISKTSTPVTEIFSKYVIENASKAVKDLINDLHNSEARQKISICSMLMGINLGNTGTALPHRMQYPIGFHTDTSHGIGLAALYPAWMKYEQKYSEEKFHNIMTLLNYDNIEDILKKMHLNVKLSELGIDKSQIDEMSNEITGNIFNDPASTEENIINKIYLESL